jgi:hypothetical protein
MWSRGDVVAIRNIWFGRVRSAVPAIVIEDDPRRFAAWSPHGTPIAVPEPRGVPTEWRLVESPWPYDGVFVHHYGEPWLAQHLRPRERPDWWYVDIVDRVQRRAASFDYRDLLLDVVTEDGLQVVDQEDLAEALRLRSLTEDEARQIERDAEEVVALVERGSPPFDGEWEQWRPPAAWGVPQLPEGWDVV